MGNLKIKVMKSEGGEQISLGAFENSMYPYPRDFNTWSWGGYSPSTHSGSGKTPSLTAIVTDGNMLSHRHLGAKKEKEKWRLGKIEIVVQDISLLRNKSRGNASWVLSSLSPQFKEPRKVLQGKAKVPGGIFSLAVRMASPSPRLSVQRQHGPSSTLGERWPLSVRAFTWSDQPTALKQCV